jgi:hypothetical protein
VVVKGLNELCDRLKKEFSNIKYFRILKRQKPHEDIFEALAGCTERCPFCKAHCELTVDKHSTSGNIKHKTHHRPECLGGMRWSRDKTMVLDVCTYSVSTDHTFRNRDTGEERHPYKRYTELYPEWAIPADKSLESSLFWKWFIGKYSKQIAKFFGQSHTSIHKEWEIIEWREVKEWLKREYHV